MRAAQPPRTLQLIDTETNKVIARADITNLTPQEITTLEEEMQAGLGEGVNYRFEVVG